MSFSASTVTFASAKTQRRTRYANPNITKLLLVKLTSELQAHFSAAWSRTGKKGPYAVYYIHCEPKATFIGGGLWHPEAAYIAKLRASIDERPRRWRRAFSDPHLKKVFFPAVKEKDGVEAVVKAFVARNQENALKKRPMVCIFLRRFICRGTLFFPISTLPR